MKKKRDIDNSVTTCIKMESSSKTRLDRSFQLKIQWKESQSDQKLKCRLWQTSPSMKNQNHSNLSLMNRFIQMLLEKWMTLDEMKLKSEKENADFGEIPGPALKLWMIFEKVCRLFELFVIKYRHI